MNNYFIGLMTGTSADALDGCIVSFDGEFKLIQTQSLELENSYKKDYEWSIKNGYKTIEESKTLAELEKILNEKSVELVNYLIKKANLNISDISYVGFSGQTVFHTNNKSYQIGDPRLLANESRINVISDFRNFDIKNGGIGAPLIPAFHKYLYSENNKKKLVFNIGGIANGTFLKNGEIYLASDVGPGNCLLDLVSKEKFNTSFDNNGDEASKGKINLELLDQLLNGSNQMQYPRADDKKDYYKIFNDSFLEINKNSLLRTLSEFTAEKIKDFYDFCDEPDEVIFHGGGTKNLFLMDLIESKLNTSIKTTDNEIPSKYVEAAGFAYLAYLKKGKIFEIK
jgi:anhydro-N-acetylmuramic acid kinase